MAIKKRILITAGPTWVSIDSARVISNIASGETGFILAKKLKKLGARITLLLGPGYFCGSQKGIKVIRFKYFEELDKLLANELKKGGYAAVIQAAAVSDYRPEKKISRKAGSNRKSWKIKLVPTKKLIAGFKKYKPGLFTVGFKFEPVATDKKLINQGRELLGKEDLDLVVANSCLATNYRAFILEKYNKYGPYAQKQKMVDGLSKLLGKKIL
ncbi:MAG: hypothetical protein COV71_01950 [Candidatus Omnitrophica bacterium CG11_big_fil_rev_8_21_14_0_20_41_12]|nr:MAG: hypothetical protein COV71_01950 [Candidatus Omnitrophica bacterium CG11_big_fil_rev_8_21_14_0_20_41_12]